MSSALTIPSLERQNEMLQRRLEQALANNTRLTVLPPRHQSSIAEVDMVPDIIHSVEHVPWQMEDRARGVAVNNKYSDALITDDEFRALHRDCVSRVRPDRRQLSSYYYGD